MNSERRLSKTKVESESDVNESENPADFGFAKKFQNLATFQFRFKLHYMPTYRCCRIPVLHGESGNRIITFRELMQCFQNWMPWHPWCQDHCVRCSDWMSEIRSLEL